jgi:hypothetical protein
MGLPVRERVVKTSDIDPIKAVYREKPCIEIHGLLSSPYVHLLVLPAVL